jgi:hypothetical protein
VTVKFSSRVAADKSSEPLDLNVGQMGAQFSTKWWDEYDVPTRFSSVQGLPRDDASRKSMLGSQGNKEEMERFAAAIRSGG